MSFEKFEKAWDHVGVTLLGLLLVAIGVGVIADGYVRGHDLTLTRLIAIGMFSFPGIVCLLPAEKLKQAVDISKGFIPTRKAE